MVDAQPIADLKLLASEIDTMTGDNENTYVSGVLVRGWVTVLRYCIARLEAAEEPRCSVCGAPMSFDATLQAHVCPHEEDEPGVD